MIMKTTLIEILEETAKFALVLSPLIVWAVL